MVCRRCITELLCLKGIGIGTKHRGLGDLQQRQQASTDYIIMLVIGVFAKWKEHVWFSKLVEYIQMDAKTVRKSIKRCMDKEWLEEYELCRYDGDRLGRNHKIFYKGYRLSKKFLKGYIKKYPGQLIPLYQYF